MRLRQARKIIVRWSFPLRVWDSDLLYLRRPCRQSTLIKAYAMLKRLRRRWRRVCDGRERPPRRYRQENWTGVVSLYGELNRYGETN